MSDDEADEEPEVEPIPEEERVPLSDLRERVEAEQADREAARNVDVEDNAPLSELAREAQSGTEQERSDLFEEVEVGDVDPKAVWDAVVEEQEPPEEVLGDAPDSGAAVEPTASADEHVIEKREYCQRCEYFTEPPDVSCTNEGTEILEMTDNDHFRVRDCPKVIDTDEDLTSVIETEE